MGKLKQLVIEVEDIIESCVQDGWDEANGTIDEMENMTRERIDHVLETAAMNAGLEIEDLHMLFEVESIEDKIENSLYETWRQY
jgi:hypothetical protein